MLIGAAKDGSSIRSSSTSHFDADAAELSRHSLSVMIRPPSMSSVYIPERFSFTRESVGRYSLPTNTSSKPTNSSNIAPSPVSLNILRQDSTKSAEAFGFGQQLEPVIEQSFSEASSVTQRKPLVDLETGASEWISSDRKKEITTVGASELDNSDNNRNAHILSVGSSGEASSGSGTRAAKLRGATSIMKPSFLGLGLGPALNNDAELVLSRRARYKIKKIIPDYTTNSFIFIFIL